MLPLWLGAADAISSSSTARVYDVGRRRGWRMAAVGRSAAIRENSARRLSVSGALVGATQRIAPFTSGLQAGGIRVPDQAIVIPGVTDGNAALLAPMATDLVARKVDAILAVGPAAVRAARAATTTIPIVAIDLESDPTDSGFIT